MQIALVQQRENTLTARSQGKALSTFPLSRKPKEKQVKKCWDGRQAKCLPAS